MGVKMELDYQGNLRCSLLHEPSGTRIGTDAPKDNMGQGALFSPTDLLAAALLSCAVTTIAIKAKKENIALPSAHGSVEKHMTSAPPRKVQALDVTITLPEALDAAQRVRVEEFGNTCPVALSLHTDVSVTMRYVYR
jgi:putative redox protein